MAIAMIVLFVTGAVLARIGMSSRGSDELLAFLGSVAIGVAGLWFVTQVLIGGCAALSAID